MSSVRIDHAVSSGTFSLDGQTFDVDNNIWVIGDDDECLVIDAPHDVDDILAVVGGRKVKAIVCTHAHDDHVRVAPALREQVVAPILLHPDDRPLWELTHTDHLWDVDLTDDQTIAVGGTTVRVLHTPGHAPGAVCLYVEDLACVFTGDTLFQGGPGATGRSYSDEDVIKQSIRDRAVRAPRRHRRAHRPRRRHHHRCGEAAPLRPLMPSDADRSERAPQHDGDEDDDAEDQRTGQDLDGSGAGLHGLRGAEPGAVGGDRTGGERQSVPPVPARPAGPAPHQDDGDGDQQRQPDDLQEQPRDAAAEPVGAGEQEARAPRRRAVEAACPRLPAVARRAVPRGSRAGRGRPRPARIPRTGVVSP